VRNLKMHFSVADGVLARRTAVRVKAVDDVSFTIARGETLGLVGESGCGKTTTGRCILQLEKPTAGEIIFEGQNLAELDRKALNEKRERMQVIFQDPYSSLNPRMKIGAVIGEPMKVHGIYPKRRERVERVVELLSVCGLNPKFMDRYPHEMSGGQRPKCSRMRRMNKSGSVANWSTADAKRGGIGEREIHGVKGPPAMLRRRGTALVERPGHVGEILQDAPRVVEREQMRQQA